MTEDAGLQPAPPRLPADIAATYVELGDLKTIARDRGWDRGFQWIVDHQTAEGRGAMPDMTDGQQAAARHRVVQILMRDFGMELDAVTVGNMMLACEDIVVTVTQETYDPLKR